MLATIKKVDDYYIARYEHHFPHDLEKVWRMLTDNEELKKWFSELRVADLREGGLITFNMGDGTFAEMQITELKMYSVLEYTWAADRVRFELYKEPEGCLLIFIETIKEITNHTPKDLAGWHVCLQVIQALLDGRTVQSRKHEWEIWYEKYKQAIKSIAED
ncbi:SRPBCC family protein [Heyndrickxia sp. FSL K6-6286]|uniref:SRPBCC family protein n=1 Tax=Heyndrickxia sp. FSL K6-6286 TaxID=2921510 RepID=UPI00315A97B1